METTERTAVRGVVPIAELTNDALIIRLHFTINHLSADANPR
jgi:hypothetical protein